MPNVRLCTHNGVDGALERSIPYTKLSWRQSLNEPGSLSAKISDQYDVASWIKPWKTIIAARENRDIWHAGYVTHVRRIESDSEWQIEAGGGLSILKKRLVLNYALSDGWVDGNVTVDEDNPSGNWPFNLRGSYSDIVRGLLMETMKWGPLPIRVADETGGGHEKNYNSYDLTTVYDRVHEISELEDGPEIRLDPLMDNTWLYFQQRTADEIVDNHWNWNAAIPGSHVVFDDEDTDGEDLCTQSFAIGGREEDKMLVARASSMTLTDQGYPVLQKFNREHSDVKQLATLKSFVSDDVKASENSPRSEGLSLNMTYGVRPGDWADVRTRHGVRKLKITDVSVDVSDGRMSLQATERV